MAPPSRPDRAMLAKASSGWAVGSLRWRKYSEPAPRMVVAAPMVSAPLTRPMPFTAGIGIRLSGSPMPAIRSLVRPHCALSRRRWIPRSWSMRALRAIVSSLERDSSRSLAHSS